MFDKIKFLLKRPFRIPVILITRFIPSFRFMYETYDYQCRANFSFWFKQKVLNIGGNKMAYWPVHWTSTVYDADKIVVGVGSCPGFTGGAYITGTGGLTIGDYCIFAKNLVIVTANHNVYDIRERIPSPVKIGSYCWLGAGAKIMPGVVLGDFTIVAAGAVVTKSFEKGYCVLGGIPAKVISELDPDKCVRFEHKHKYIGYIKQEKFAAFRKKKLKL
ncbi:MAG TPA: acyltransferase [Ferruginibacter sp.]|nr:acyltransferase [Ferruginibacter sp.]HMP21258.1 acyltransferase [Ferruginibacter sp.]